jgi:anti-sigma B factor antagonist
MFWQRPFMHGVSGDGWVPVQDLTATFTVVDLAGWLVDENAINDPRRTPGRPEPRETARTDVVSGGLRVISDRVGDAVVVRAIGEVDARSADVLASALRAGWVAARRPGPLVVDLSGVVFFSVVGLELLITTEQHCRDRDLPLRLVATRGVLRALRLTGLDVLFDITTPARATRPRANPDWIIRN